MTLRDTICWALMLCAVALADDRGLGEGYTWAPSLEAGLAQATEEGKPTFLLIHKSWCGACKSLKPKFAESKSILELSKYFVMINLLDEEEPMEKVYAPDGGYIPRILFISPDGNILTEISNEMGSNQHKYFYSQPDHIVASMKKVLRQFDIQPIKVNKGNEEL